MPIHTALELLRNTQSRGTVSVVVGTCWLLLTWSVTAAEIPEQDFVDRVYHDAAGAHRYVVFVPPANIPRPLPVVLFLHGAGEKGSDGRRQLHYGLGTALERFPNYPAYVVFPQCEDLTGRHLIGWRADRPDAQRALRILDEVIATYPIDAARQSLCGWSMGGYGAWSLAATQPARWKAVLAIAGGGDGHQDLAQLAQQQLPVWAVHGAEDVLVPASASTEMITALKALQGTGTLTMLPETGHDSWRWALGNHEAMLWLLDPQSSPPQLSNEPLPSQSSAALAGPFQPDVVLPGALAVRLGNAALAVMAEGIPTAIPEAALMGEMADVRREIPFQGKQYTLEMTNLRYRTQLAACELQGISGERLRVRFWLQPLVITFGGATLRAEKLLATADEFRVVIGQREPVAITLEVRPEAVHGQLRLIVLRQDFQIPDDNWYIDRPKLIRSFSHDLPVAYVETGLIGGLYQRREDVEQQVLSVIPALLAELEQHLQNREAGQSSYNLWPLPVLAPESRFMPGKIRTDRHGISAEVSLAAKFPDRAPNNSPLVLPPLGRSVQSLGTGEQMRVQVAWGIIDQLSAQYARNGSARINVLDLPQPEFQRLASSEVISQVLPGLEAQNLDVILQLAAPLTLLPTDAPGSPGRRTLALSSQDVRIRYVQRNELGVETELATFSLAIEQPLDLRWSTDAEGLTGTLNWTIPANIVEHSQNPLPPARELIREVFSQGWTAWVASQPESSFTVPPIHVGSRELYPQHLLLEAGQLEVEFGAAIPTLALPIR